jgi:regulation of enolase protein 1 (concanavalin A-like superfamily)
LDFDPSERWQVAGMGLRPADDSSTWIALRRISGDGQVVDLAQTTNNNSEGVASIPYAKTVIYFHLSRTGEQISFMVSENGVNWIALKTDHIFALPNKVNLFLYVYSTTGHGILAQFSDLLFGSPTPRQISLLNGPIALASDSAPEKLDSAWGWFPGASSASTYSLSEGRLALIAGPGTDFWYDRNWAPSVEYPVAGDFQAQVRLSFAPTERWQAAGLGLRSAKDRGTWIAIRRVSGGGNEQYLDAAQTRAYNSEGVKTIPYTQNIVYLRLHRSEPLISLYYSPDGNNWTPLLEDFVIGFPEQVEIFLFVYSTPGNRGASATFSEFMITPP